MENQPHQNSRFSHISTENNNKSNHILKNKAELEAKIKQINVFAGERKKYLDSALDEILKDSKIVGALLSLLKFGSQKNTQSQEPEETPENKRKRKFGR